MYKKGDLPVLPALPISKGICSRDHLEAEQREHHRRMHIREPRETLFLMECGRYVTKLVKRSGTEVNEHSVLGVNTFVPKQLDQKNRP